MEKIIYDVIIFKSVYPERKYMSIHHKSPESTELSFSVGTVWKLTWPQIMVMFFFFSMGLCDVWTAGKLSNDIQAAFGLVAQGNMFLQVLAMALASGATATISQAIGARRMKRAVRYVALVILLTLTFGTFLAIVAYLGKDLIFGFLQTPESILPVTLSYWNITLLTLPLSYVFSSTSTLFRATRQVIPPVFVAFFMALGNVIGNLGFGLGYFGFPEFGYLGIAWTTFVCVGLGALANVILLIHKNYFNYKKIPPWRWVKNALPYLYKVAIPSGISQLTWQTGYLVLFAVTASLPFDKVHALAGLTAGMRLEALLFLPGMAFSMTASVLVGNSLGAKNAQQAQALARMMYLVGMGVMSVVALLLWSFIPQMAQVLTDDPITQEITKNYLHINFLCTPFMLASMILGGVMTGAGATRYNLIVFGCSFWFVRLPVAYVLGHFIWQSASGVFVGMLVSQVVQAALMIWVLERFPWKSFAMGNKRKSK